MRLKEKQREKQASQTNAETINIRTGMQNSITPEFSRWADRWTTAKQKVTRKP